MAENQEFDNETIETDEANQAAQLANCKQRLAQCNNGLYGYKKYGRQSEGFLYRYRWWIVGLLFIVLLIYVLYYRDGSNKLMGSPASTTTTTTTTNALAPRVPSNIELEGGPVGVPGELRQLFKF